MTGPSESEVGIYNRKQESKKTRKQELDKESDKEKSFFLVEFSFSFLLSFSLSRVLVFFFKLPPLNIREEVGHTFALAYKIPKASIKCTHLTH